MLFLATAVVRKTEYVNFNAAFQSGQVNRTYERDPSKPPTEVKWFIMFHVSILENQNMLLENLATDAEAFQMRDCQPQV